ncbi:MAG: right-handed parallel beta-helix repeat-containing protein [Spirochaetes bacterium]|nr:right-handed parallel beta-helix repeat-containing protein [Spirochaetota bacterium]
MNAIVNRIRISVYISLCVVCIAARIHAAGALVPFITLEGEAGTPAGGAVIKAFIIGDEVPAKATFELEASGGAYMLLEQEGAQVSWMNPAEGMNAMTIRASIPDAENGGGIETALELIVDGVFRQYVTLRSTQSWVYRGKEGWSNDPTKGAAMKFYNEERVKITGEPVKKGSTITLRKGPSGAAVWYRIDCIDVESAAPAGVQPADSLSAVDFGADPAGEKDSQEAIERCIAEARTSGKTVWLPAGTFLISSKKNNALDVGGVTVRGAGMWHTAVYRKPPAVFTGVWRSNIRVGSLTRLSDLFIDCNSVTRAIGKPGGGDYGIAAGGSNWIVERVWIQHCDANWMSGTDGVIRRCRVADSWGDGINLNNGNRPNPDALGLRLRAEENFVRGTGDDGLATYSDAGGKRDNGKMSGSTFISNTSVAPYWANALRIAGGIDVVVRDNLLCDASGNCGIEIGTFGESGHPLESVVVEGNVIRRGGGWNTVNRHGMSIGYKGVPGNRIVVRNNIIEDSRRAGIAISGDSINLVLEGNRVSNPAAAGILIRQNTSGAVRLSGNVVTNLRPGQVSLKDDSGGGVRLEY